MKILNIYFKNINSLEGESRVHFDQAPLAESGVFAITGVNGSGKSSIIDVITLGLYGETFRFDRPAQHVMTKSTAESFAEVEFLIGEDKYKSSWQVKREGGLADGELLPAEMKLIKLNDPELVMADSTQKVRDKMSELTGMDFHKFNKSMVLAQGDFSAFLNALDSERMDILEKISGTGLEQQIKQQVEEKHTQAKIVLQQVEQDLNAIPLMDEATRQAKEHDLADFSEQLLELENQQQILQEQLSQVEKTQQLIAQQENSNTKKQQIEQQLQDTQQQLDQVTALQDVVQLESELLLVDDKAEQVKKYKTSLNNYQSEMQLLQQQLTSRGVDNTEPVAGLANKSFTEQKKEVDELKLKFSELKFNLPKENALLQSLQQQHEEKKSELSATELWLSEHGADQGLLQNFPETEKLRILKDEATELAKKQKAFSKWSKNINAKLAKVKSDISTIIKKNSVLKAQIIEDEKASKDVSEGYSLLDLQEMKGDQQERLANFKELLELANVNAKISKKGFFSKFVSAKVEGKEEKELNAKLDLIQLEIGREQNIVTILETAIINEALLVKLQPERVHLVDGKPCPLCGSLKHPYAKQAPAASNSKQILFEQKKKVKLLKVSAEDLNKQIVAVQQQTIIDEQKDDKLQNVHSQWNRLANKLNSFSQEMDINNLSYIKDLLKEEKKEMENVSNLTKRFSKLQSSMAVAKAAIEANELALKRLNEEAEALAEEKNSRPLESSELEKVFLQCQKDEAELSAKVLKQLTTLGEKMPSKSKEKALAERLNNRRQDYQAQLKQKETLAQEIKSLETNLASSSKNIADMNQAIQESSKQVEQEETVGLHLSLIEKQKLISEQEHEFKQQSEELNTLEQTLIEKTKQQEGLADLTALREKIDLVKGLPKLQQKQLDIKQSMEQVENELNKITKQLEVAHVEAQINESSEELLTKLRSITEKLDISQQEVDTLEDLLGKQNGLQQRHEQLVSKLTKQQAEFEVCESELKLISEENSLHFRHKVQQLMVDKLLSQTNQVLEKISGRYYVRKVESEHGLALEIEDTKQFNVRRLPKSLSGGESFVVSLALALALADMSNAGHAVDSLFLDEGFGNLDSESLYLVMTTLESLKTHGKLVGIISHVEGVRKRIKTQIEMIKKPNGLSALKMVS